MTGDTEVLLDVRDLNVRFRRGGGDVVAVEDVSFAVDRGSVLAVVGESGSGKSVMTRALLGLLPETARVDGSASLAGQQLVGLDERAMRRIRGPRIGLVLQDPLRALDPTMKVGHQIGETLRLHTALNRRAVRERVVELMDEVRISNPRARFDDYPHQFSGGMRQRAAIAMALACGPDLLIADEPTTALDSSTQAEIMTLLRRLQRERSLTVLFISHDLTLAADMADQIVVMYGGRIMERLPAAELERCRVPYTASLLAASPAHTVAPRSYLPVIPGSPLSRRGEIDGCVFVERCDHAVEKCRSDTPVPVRDPAGRHEVRCWHLTTGSTT